MMKTKYFLGTAKQVGEFVANHLCEEFNAGKKFEFPNFSFAVKSDRCPTEDLRDIAEWSEGWYGVYSIDTPFDTGETATICGNYFGGGCATAGSLWLDELDCPEYVAPVIANVMRRSIEMQETVNDNTTYIVEFEEH